MFSHKPSNVEIVLILPWSMAYFVKQFMANVIAVTGRGWESTPVPLPLSVTINYDQKNESRLEVTGVNVFL